MTVIQPEKDHDLLISLHEQMKQVRLDIADIKIGLLKNYIDPALIKDHEARIRRLERWGLMAIGALGLIQLIGFAYFFEKLFA